MSSSPPLLVADRYRLVAPLGQGGMGRVWRATDVVLHRDVAIKELVPPPGLTPAERQEMRERSLREARAIARLNNINVVRVFDVLRTDADPWIVMEYVPSRSLQDSLAGDGPVNPVRAAEIGLGVLNALRAAHRAGVVHRDVKPGNVLIGADGRVVLTDFGLATVPGDPNVTRTGLVLGSPAYIAPERARDGTAGPAADLWSLGATLYAAVEGQSPYARPSAIATLAALATENVPTARNAGPLKPVLNGLLRKDPAHRINAEEAERLLLRAAGRRSKLAFPMSPTMRRPGVGRERPSLPSGPGGPPVLPGTGFTTGSAPVVPGPRPPVAPGRPPVAPGNPARPPAASGNPARPPAASGNAPVTPGRPGAAPAGPGTPPGRTPFVAGRPALGDGRPAFAPGKAPVGGPIPPADKTPRRAAAPLDATRVDTPAVRDADQTTMLSGTRQAPPPARPGQGGASGPAAPPSAASETVKVTFTAADVAANRRRAAAPEHERSLAEATARFSAPAEPAVQATTVIPASTPAAGTKPQAETGKPTTGTPEAAEPQPGVKSTVETDATSANDGTSARDVKAATSTSDAKAATAGTSARDAKAAGASTSEAKAAAAGTSTSDAKAATAGTSASEAKAATGGTSARDAKAAAAGTSARDAKAAGASTSEAKAAAAGTSTSIANLATAGTSTPEAKAATPATASETTAPDPTAPDAETTVADATAADPTAADANTTVADPTAAEPTAPDSTTTNPKAAADTPATDATFAESPAGADSTPAADTNPSAEHTPAGAEPAGAEPADAEPGGAEPVDTEPAADATTSTKPDPATPTPDAPSDPDADTDPNATAAPADPTGTATNPGHTSADDITADRKTTHTPEAPSTSAVDRTDKEPPAADATMVVRPDAAAETRVVSALPRINRSTRPAWNPVEIRPVPRRGGITVFGTTLTRRQAAIGIAILTTFVLLVGLLVAQAFGSDKEQATASVPQTGATSGSKSAAKPSSAPAASASATPTGGLATLPEGWELYRGNGFTVPIRKGAEIRGGGEETRIKWKHYLLIVNRFGAGTADPVADWKAQEQGNGRRSYRKIDIRPVQYFGAAADWEFTYTTESGNPQRAVKRAFSAGKKTYNISWYTSPEEWEAAKADLDVIYRGFQPK